MRMQIYSMTITRTLSAFLTGVIIAFKYMLAPFNVFTFTSGNSVLMGFVYVVFPLGLLGAFSLLAGSWMCQFRASFRTEFTKHSTFTIFWHQLITNRTRCLNTNTGFAKLVKEIGSVRTFAAHSASSTNRVGISLQMRSTSYTSRVLSWFSHYGYLRCWLSAYWARYTRLLLTCFTNSIFPTVFVTNFAQIFSHTAIIPQLPDLGVNYEM